ADSVAIAIGYNADPLIPSTTEGVRANRWHLLEVDPDTGQTSRPGVFAGGDNVNGADLVVTALADGRRAAAAMHRHLMLLGTRCEITAHLAGDTLVSTGTVPTAEDKRAVEHEVQRLRGSGIERVRNELVVRDENAEEKGLLTQTLVASFENEEQARFARGYLE